LEILESFQSEGMLDDALDALRYVRDWYDERDPTIMTEAKQRAAREFTAWATEHATPLTEEEG
jgi:hypothetical protein